MSRIPSGIRLDNQQPQQVRGIRLDPQQPPAPVPQVRGIRVEPEQPPAQPQTEQDVLLAALAEIEQLNAAQRAAGRPTLSAGAQTALTDQLRIKAGFEPRLPQQDELNRVDFGAAAEASQGPIADFLTAPALPTAAIGTNIVGLFSPDTARRLRESQQAFFGTGPRSTAGKVFGETIGGGANVIASIPLGVVGAGAAFGASGAGGVRTDVNELRREGEEISVADETKAAGLTGIIEGTSGLITGGLLNKARGLVGSVGSQTLSREAGAKGLRELARRELPDVVTEVGEEMAAQLLTNAVRKNFIDEDTEVTEGVIEAGLFSILPIIGARATAKRIAPARVEQAERRARQERQRRGEPEPPTGPFELNEVSGPDAPFQTFEGTPVGPTQFETFEGTPVGPAPEQVVEGSVIEGATPEAQPTPNFADPELRIAADLLARQTPTVSQAPTRGVIPQNIVGADVTQDLQAEPPKIEAPKPAARGAEPTITQAPVAADAQIEVPQFPARLETQAEVEQFFGTMEKDSALLASMVDEPVVLVDIPLDAIPNQQLGFEGEIVPEKLERVRKGDVRTQPPILAVAVGRDNLFIPDGNHRVVVARERGNKTIKGFVPESVAQQRGFLPSSQTPPQQVQPTNPEGDTTFQQEAELAELEQQAIDAGVIRPTDPEPTPEQRREQSRRADAEIQRQAEQAEAENLAVDSTTSTTGATPRSAVDSSFLGSGDPGPQFGLGREGRPIFETTYDQPSAKQLQELHGLIERGRMGRAFRKVKGLLQEKGRGELGVLEGRLIEARQREKIAASRQARVNKGLNKLAKEVGIDLDGDVDTQLMLESLLRNETVQADPRLKAEVEKFRKAVDASSTLVANAQRAAGLDPTTFENNLGTFLPNVTKRSAEESRNILRTGAKIFAPTQSFNKVKRDAYLLWDGKTLVGKFPTAAAANNRRAAIMSTRKDALIRAGARRRGVTENDLKNRAAKGLVIEEPISADQRRETEVHDIRYLTTKAVLDNTHNANMIDMHVAAADTYGIPAPAGLSASQRAQWAAEQNLVPLPARGVLHNLDVFVPKRVGDLLEEYTNIPSGVNEFLNNLILRKWKAAMTVYNPATWGRNYIGSQVHAVLDGSSIFDPRNWPAYAQAMVELSKKDESPLVLRLMERGALDSDYDADQAKQVLIRSDRTGSVMDGLMGSLSTVHKGLARGYSYGDNLAKVASVIVHQKRNGLHLDAAMREMERSFPIFTRTSRIADFARDNVFLGAPFVSYMDQSIRNVGRGFVRDGAINPNVGRAALLMSSTYMIDQLSRAALGVTDDEDELLERQSPAGFFLKTLAEPIVWNPFSSNGRDDKGRVMRLNLRYIIPAIHDFVPQMNNGSLQLPFGFFSGPVIDTIIEQVSGKERFSGRDFLNDDQTLREQAAERAKRLVATFTPLPPELKRGFRRPRLALQGQSEEPVANAMLATLTGIDTKTPFLAEKEVKELINNALDSGQAGEAIALFRLWNERYRPDNKTKLDPNKVLSGFKASLRSKRASARRKAADAMFLGNDRQAQREIDKYNAERGETAPPLTLEEVEGEVSAQQERGRKY